MLKAESIYKQNDMGEGVTLTKEAYIELVNADIKALNEFMPASLEKRHILMVLQWSIDNYPQGKKIPKEEKYTCSDLLPDGFVFSESGRVILNPEKYPKED